MQLHTFSAACEQLYLPGLSMENCTERVYQFLRRLVPAELVACALLDTREKRLEVGLDTPHPDFASAIEAYSELMGNYPLYNFDPSTNDGRPFCRSHFYSQREFRNLDVFHEVYRPLGIDNHCAVHIPSQPGEILFFAIERKGGPDFLDEDLAVLSAAQPLITNALATARAISQSSEKPVWSEALVKAGLTPREAETLYWLTEGKTNPETACLLGIGIHTVKDHVTSIFNKTGAGNRLAAIVWAREVCQKHFRSARLYNPGAVLVPAPLQRAS